jgi:hypothetical protein
MIKSDFARKFSNKTTKVSSWTKPDELKTQEEVSHMEEKHVIIIIIS